MATSDTETETDPKTKPGKGGRTGARARIEVEGDIDQTKVSDVLDAAGRGGRRSSAAAAGDPEAKFAKVIRNPRNKIIAARLQPQTMSDGTPLNDTLELPCHEGQSLEEIKRDIQEARGGRKWIIRVYDSNEEVVASRAEAIAGNPRMDPMLEGMDQVEEEPMETQTELTDAEVLERTLAADPDVIKAQKKLRLKQIQAEEEEEDAKLEETRARRTLAQRAAKGESETNGNGNGKHRHDDDEDEAQSNLMKAIEAANAPLKEANAALQRRLDDAEKRNSEKESKAEQQRMIEAQTGPLKEMLAAQKTSMDQMMAKLNAPAPTGPTTDALMAKLDAMKAEIKSDAKDQISTITANLTEKINTVATTLNTFMAKGNDPATAALIALATGGKGGAASTDPFHGLERALTVLQNMRGLTEKEAAAPPDFPSYLVEKMAETTPEVLNFFREQRGAVPTKEDIEKMMRDAAMKMYNGLNASMQKELQAAFQRIQGGQPAALPAAQQTQPAAQPGPEVVVAPAAQGATPTPVAFPGSATPAASPAAPAAPTAGVLTPQQLWDSLNQADRAEYSKRVNYVLGGLGREMEIGANEMAWPQHAIDKLPRRMIEQFVEASTDTEVYEIIRRYADSKLLDRIWSFLSASHPKHEWYQGWLATGINWIKEAEGAEVVQPADEGPPVVDDAQ